MTTKNTTKKKVIDAMILRLRRVFPSAQGLAPRASLGLRLSVHGSRFAGAGTFGLWLYTFSLRVLLVVVVLWPLSSVASDEVPSQGAVATSHPLATQVGVEILELGGNAFDAAVAIAATLSVVEPHRSGLGGGGFWLLHVADEEKSVMVDAREAAPLVATRDMYVDKERNRVPGLSTGGPLAAGIPGEAAGMVHIAEHYGKLPLRTCLEPAIRMAREGFEVYAHYLSGIRPKLSLMLKSPAAAAVYLDGGTVPDEEFIVRQPDLAVTLVALAQQGHDGFYAGEVAQRLVSGVREAGGIWSLEDLATYAVRERAPLTGYYKDIRIVSAAPPSAGGVILINTLNILSGYDLAALGSVERKHVIVEAMRRGYRHRSGYLGDPDFVDIPLEKLLDQNYADRLRSSIRIESATPSSTLSRRFRDTPKGTQTTHYSVLDTDGNRVSASLSLNFWFGSGFMPQGTGVLLNNQMNDFRVVPGPPDVSAPNRIEPGKRMLSSMSPTFLESERGIVILGTPGGSRIISMTLLATLAWHDGATADELVSLPRYHHQYQPDEIFFEPGILSAAEIAKLEQIGHTLRESSRRYGNMQVVTWDFETGVVEAASDPRGSGEVLVY